MPETHDSTFADDAPLTDRALDRLNRAPFAAQVAQILRELPANKGLVVGIHGLWGDGKTTVLNLIRQDLAQLDTVVVRDFNPWRLTDDDAMLRGFLGMLAEALGASLATKGERAVGVAGKLAGQVRWITKSVGVIWKPADAIDSLLARLTEAAKAGDSLRLEELRARLVATLGQSSTRVIILVDDLDRLDRDETHMLFRLVKACADLPNVCFVLAFDDDAVAAALGYRYADGGASAGRSFLEKIIQVPLRLPVAAREDLRTICLEQVDAVLVSAGVELTEDQVGEFVTGFDAGAVVRLTTPRAAKRYGNGLRFALPALVGEVNTVDLLLVEALRAFYPDVYAVVRDNHSDFSGVEGRVFGTQNEEPRAGRLLAPALDRLSQDEAEAAKHLLVDLFPRLAGIYLRNNYGPDWVERWTREKRISSPQYCARYFTYAVPHSDVPDAEMTSLLDVAASGDIGAVRERLGSLFAGKMAARSIEKLRSVESTVDAETAKTLALAIAPLGSVLPNPVTLFSHTQPPGQAAILTSHLLARIPDRDERMAIAAQVVEAAEPLWFAAECIRWFRVTDKPEKEGVNALTSEEEQRVRILLVERIKAAAEAGDPLFDPSAYEQGSLLFEWQRVEGTDPVQEHLLRVFNADPSQVPAFLKSMANRAWGGDSALPHLGDFDGDNLRNIRRLIDLDVLADLIRANVGGDFEVTEWSYDTNRPDEQRLAEQFMYIYNKWRTEGEPAAASGEPSESDH